MNLQSQLPDASSIFSIYTPTNTPQKGITQATEPIRVKRSPNFEAFSNDECLKASDRLLAYTSFSDYGLQEPEGPKSLEITREEDPPPQSPPTTMERIKSVLSFESNRK